jgi:transcriptional regulator with XRE-family HTH domain
MQIKIDEEFKSLIPPMSRDERMQLEDNLLSDGCREPLVLWKDTIVDGHNRYEICTRLDIDFETVQMEFGSRNDAVIWIIKNQFGRRNLPDYERAKLALRLKPAIAEKAKESYQENVGSPKESLQKSAPIKVDTRAELAKAAGVSHDTIAKVERIERTAAPELKQALASEKVSINAASKLAELPKEEQKIIVEMTAKDIVAKANQIKRDQKVAKRQAKIDAEFKAIESIHQKAKADISDVADIRHCSCKELFASGIRPDVVITDPPYPREFLDTFTELAEGCALAGVRVVAVMSGQSYLPEVMERLCKHLKYRWTMAYLTPGGQAVQLWQAKVNTFWKPLLVFGEAVDWFGDVVKSDVNDNDKRFHNWGQSESGLMDWIRRMSKPGDLICDPFMGAGTTAVAALACGRRFVGCDIDEKHVERTQNRCEEVSQ